VSLDDRQAGEQFLGKGRVMLDPLLGQSDAADVT